MKIKQQLMLILLVTAAAAVFGSDASAQQARVTMSYLPQTLVAAPRGGKDIPVEVELIFRETGGASVRFDQLNRSFVLSSGMRNTDPVSFIDKILNPGAEEHEDVTIVIPASSATLCLGGMTTCDMTVRLEYSGLDERGNNTTTSIDIPIQLTQSAAAETFAIGDVVIKTPADGATLPAGKISAAAQISVTGVGSVAGQWLINGKQAGSFSKDVMGEGAISLTLDLPAGLAGKNTLTLRVTQPVLKESKTISFTAAPAGKPAGDIQTFRAGKFDIAKVTSNQDPGGATRSGQGTLAIPALGLEIPITFQGLAIIDNNGKAELAGGQIIADVNKTIDRGPLHTTISQMLISTTGAWADGSATLEPSGLATGIGPLYFYAIPLDANGIDGTVKLEKPQQGKQGDYTATVESFEIHCHAAVASLNVTGHISKTGQQADTVPLAISVSIGAAEK